MTSKRQRACSGRRGRVLPVDGPAPGLLCCTMQRELAALQSQLAALQRPGGDAGRFAGACFAISQRLEAHGKGSRPAKARNLIRELAALGSAVAAQGRQRAGGVQGPPEAASRFTWGLAAISHSILRALLALEDRESQQGHAVQPGLGDGQLAGALAWPLALVRALPATLQLVPTPEKCLTRRESEAVCNFLGHVAAQINAQQGSNGAAYAAAAQNNAQQCSNGAAYAAAAEEMRALVPPLLRALVWAIGRSPLPGQDGFSPGPWAHLLAMLSAVLRTDWCFGDAAAAALSEECRGGRLGSRLSSQLLALLTGMAQMGPPAQTGMAGAAASMQGDYGSPARQAAARWQNDVLECWEFAGGLVTRAEL